MYPATEALAALCRLLRDIASYKKHYSVKLNTYTYKTNNWVFVHYSKIKTFKLCYEELFSFLFKLQSLKASSWFIIKIWPKKEIVFTVHEFIFLLLFFYMHPVLNFSTSD